MNCLKCGAQLEEGSTSTLCANCQALENSAPEEKLSENVPPETTENPTDIPVSNEPVQPTENVESPVETPDNTNEEQQPPSGV